MQKAATIALLAASFSLSSTLRAQGQALTPASLPDFLTQYERSLNPLEAAYADLASEPLPLKDEAGQPLGHRPVENRRDALAALRETLHQLARHPGDLVLTVTLFLETESLTDDLFDLSQIAYDNDREELGKRLSDLMKPLDERRDLIEAYALSVAGDAQKRIQGLETENRDLQQKLKTTRKTRAADPFRRP